MVGEKNDSAAALAGRFRTTHWTVVLNAGHTDERQRSNALEELCRTYWYPVYAFVRREGFAAADAQDLTQGFFAHLLERQTFETADPERGRFRSFLLGALKRFLGYERRKQLTLKRGGQAMVVPIDEEESEERYQVDLVYQATPEKLYQRSWADALLASTLELLRRDYERAGKMTLFEKLQPHLSGADREASYQQLGDMLGLSVPAVTTSMYRMRKRYGELLREQIAQTVSSPNEVDDEIAFLFSAVET
jgi:RNA polymerase sigma factor (sigma-70 family)